MKQFTSEIVNGAIFAALVVLTSEMHRLGPQPRLAEPSQRSVVSDPAPGSDVRAARTESFAASLARSSFAPDAARDARASAAVPAVSEQGSAPASGQVVRDTPDPGMAAASAQRPVAALVEQAAVKPAASRIPDSKIDAFVPPIRRQRPVTPPLAFNAPAEKAAKGSGGKKVAKTKVKRAAARKGQEPARSSLGAGARAKVASDAAIKANQAAASKSKQ